MKRRYLLSLLTLVAVFGSLLGLFWAQRHRTRQVVHAALSSSGTFDAAKALQDTSGGMAQYGYAIQQAADLSTDFQAITNWNTYIASRSGWSMSSTISSRLASADWNARQAGPPAITAQQLANAANHLISSALSTMTANQQSTLFWQNFSEQTPKGRWGLNPGYPYITATQNADGTWTVTVSPDAFAKRKSNFLTLAPGIMSPSTNFYPAEAMIVTYSIASWDMGFNSTFVSNMKQGISDFTGLDMSSQYLYGDSGHLVRRPLSMFLTDQRLSQFFSDLGF